ncbi:MAG: ArsA family ATPase [Anaerolineae bacterium]|nr:MAG: ArsA family ATPase [Anaerolineae bacterium]
MPFSELDHSGKRVIMFGGKGGVGKTTCSATTALHYSLAGRKTLIVSSDLTPSLSDIFETEIGPTERPIAGVPNLFGLEINPEEVMARWKEKFGPQVYAAASALVDMPYDQLIDYVAIAPGIQEEFMLDYILERVRDGRYDLIVWDTAPAGDTLRLLGLPQQFLQHLRMAPKVYLEVRDAFNLKKVPFLELIQSWSELSEEVVSFFRDPANTEFVLVTIPEALGAYQTQRLVGEFARYGLKIRYLIVNHVIQEPDCPFHQQRAAMQRPYIELLAQTYDGQLEMIQLPAFAREMKGIDRLSILERVLFEG